MGFDPLKNTPSNCTIWVKLPNLPLELWSVETLMVIGNSVGKSIYVDPWVRGEKDKRIAWVLIEKPYKGGYPEQIEITWEGSMICQRLDYWGIAFWCSLCHRTGHLINNCRLHFKWKTKRFPLQRGRITAVESQSDDADSLLNHAPSQVNTSSQFFSLDRSQDPPSPILECPSIP